MQTSIPSMLGELVLFIHYQWHSNETKKLTCNESMPKIRKKGICNLLHPLQNTDPMAFLDFSCYRDHSPAILTIFIFSSKLITKLLTGYSYPLWTLLNANNLQWFLHNQTTIYQWRHNMLKFRAKTFSHLALLPNCTEDYCHRLKNILVCNSF